MYNARMYDAQAANAARQEAAEAAASARWEAIAEEYGKSFGEPVSKTDFEYTRCIMSLLSDAQEQASLGDKVRSNDSINAAKLMLWEMGSAMRAAESPRTIAIGG